MESMNGYVLRGVIIPEDAIVHFTSFLDKDTLLSCRLVCRSWQGLVDARVWKHKLRREKHKYASSQALCLSQDLPFTVYYSIFNKDPYGRNLIKNPSGLDGLRHWHVFCDMQPRFIVEDCVVGSCDPAPDGSVDGHCSAFLSVYGDSLKEQWIDLMLEGVPWRVMDRVRPVIQVSDCYGEGGDCDAYYEWAVSLCTEDKVVLEEYGFKVKMIACKHITWKKVSHSFCKYPPGVRFICFQHAIKGTKHWMGERGNVVRNSCVRLTFLPEDNFYSTVSDEDSSPDTSVTSDDADSNEDAYSDGG